MIYRNNSSCKSASEGKMSELSIFFKCLLENLIFFKLTNTYFQHDLTCTGSLLLSFTKNLLLYTFLCDSENFLPYPLNFLFHFLFNQTWVTCNALIGTHCKKQNHGKRNCGSDANVRCDATQKFYTRFPTIKLQCTPSSNFLDS